MRASCLLGSFLSGALLSTSAFGGERSTLEELEKLRSIGLPASQVMSFLEDLTVSVGPRLNGSPGAEAAARWAAARMRDLGLENVVSDRFDFGGVGWWYSRAQARMLGVDGRTLAVLPEAWTAGLAAPLVAEATVMDSGSEEDRSRFRAHLRGKIVLVGAPVSQPPLPVEIKTIDAQELQRLKSVQDTPPYGWKQPFLQQFRMRAALDRFLVQQGARAVIWPSEHPNGLIGATGYTYRKGEQRPLPNLVMAREDYNQVARRALAGMHPRLELLVEAKIDPRKSSLVNILGEVRGEDPAAGVVMAGAHLDSWHDATGASDNAAGVATLLEAARILKTAAVHLKRTVRFALWEGEELGMLGAQSYVERRIGKRGPGTDRSYLQWAPFMQPDRDAGFVPNPRPEHIVAYFNMDGGTGRIRGLYAPGQPGCAEILDRWRAPVADLGVDVISPWQITESDDWPFRDAGIPAFLFLQDGLDRDSLTHHTHIDTLEHIRPQALSEAAVVVASYLYQAANADNPLPRE